MAVGIFGGLTDFYEFFLQGFTDAFVSVEIKNPISGSGPEAQVAPFGKILAVLVSGFFDVLGVFTNDFFGAVSGIGQDNNYLVGPFCRLEGGSDHGFLIAGDDDGGEG